MTYHLPQGWDPVIEKDIDGERAETTELEGKEPRFGQVNAARRVARTLFLGSAPSSVATKPGIRGLDRGRVLLGCLQPGQTTAVYADALGRLADRLHYLNSSGDKAAAATRFWFDTRANLRREMEDRKQRFDKTDVRKKIEEVAKKLFLSVPPFDGVHVFTPHSDVPDDSALRLVVLPPEQPFLKEDPRQATSAVLEHLRTHGNQPRHRANRLIFLAADDVVLNRLRDVTRVALAWASIVEDVSEGRLNIDQIQRKQAEKESQAANAVVPRAARECFKWLLCPVQDDPTAPKPTVESFSLNTTSGNAPDEVERVCRENALVIDTWSPIHLRDELRKLYWKGGKVAVGAMAFWEDTLRYLYLPRLKNRHSLSQAIRTGAATRDFFGTALGQSGETFEGFRFGDGNVQLDDTLLLIEPEAATQYEASLKKPDVGGGTGTGDGTGGTTTGGTSGTGTGGQTGTTTGTGTGTGTTGGTAAAKPKSFHGSIQITPSSQDASRRRCRRDHQHSRGRPERDAQHHTRNQRRVPEWGFGPDQACRERERHEPRIQNEILGIAPAAPVRVGAWGVTEQRLC